MGKILYLTALAVQPRSISQLARAAGVDPGHASRVCAELVRAGWMRTTGSRRGLLPVPAMPDALQEQHARRLFKMLAMAPQKGEFLMKCWLDLLVASNNLIDNARPGFLCNPLTGEPLEFDRYYLEGVAFEFNGRQHYGPTAAYPDEQAFRELRARDLLKKGLSQEQGIVLVEVISEDLTFDNMERKIPDVLPRNIIDRDGLYAKALARASQDYRAKAGH
ncbi:MAG: hypothetical protein HPY55_08530 [Firmicutes bacterium]|nr:hypothetical protein [Bacillota bacterium]